MQLNNGRNEISLIFKPAKSPKVRNNWPQLLELPMSDNRLEDTHEDVGGEGPLVSLVQQNHLSHRESWMIYTVKSVEITTWGADYCLVLSIRNDNFGSGSDFQIFCIQIRIHSTAVFRIKFITKGTVGNSTTVNIFAQIHHGTVCYQVRYGGSKLFAHPKSHKNVIITSNVTHFSHLISLGGKINVILRSYF